MGDLFTMVGFFGFFGSLAMLIYALIIKYPVRSYLIGIGVSLVAFVLGSFLTVAPLPPESEKVVFIVLLVGAAVWAVISLLSRFIPRRLEGGYNVAGKVAYKGAKFLGIKDPPAIVEVKYLGAIQTDSKRGGLGGALLGGILYGPLGVPIGGLTPKGTKTLCRFAVRYDNGDMRIQDCYEGSVQYNELLS